MTVSMHGARACTLGRTDQQKIEQPPSEADYFCPDEDDFF